MSETHARPESRSSAAWAVGTAAAIIAAELLLAVESRSRYGDLVVWRVRAR